MYTSPRAARRLKAKLSRQEAAYAEWRAEKIAEVKQLQRDLARVADPEARARIEARLAELAKVVSA